MSRLAGQAGAKRSGAERSGARRPSAGQAGAGVGGTASQRGDAGRPRFTGRAAVLAVVLCAVALSLAYPVREYLAQRRQIDALLAQRAQIGQHLHRLELQQQKLKSPAFIEQLARDRLHMCLPTQMCYVIIDPSGHRGKDVEARRAATPWYGRLWSSVQQANYQPPVNGRAKAGQG